MPIRAVPNTDVTYHLCRYDAHGVERSEKGAKHSGTVASRVHDDPITDVILVSHGWSGDIPAAIDQYDRWIAAMLTCTADKEAAEKHRPGFNPLIVGVHWPSLAWGDENLDDYSFDLGNNSFDRAVDDLTNAIGGGESIEAAVRNYSRISE